MLAQGALAPHRSATVAQADLEPPGETTDDQAAKRLGQRPITCLTRLTRIGSARGGRPQNA